MLTTFLVAISCVRIKAVGPALRTGAKGASVSSRLTLEVGITIGCEGILHAPVCFIVSICHVRTKVL